MNAFFAAVEMRDDPQLRGRPVAVGGEGPRSVIAAASYDARTFGVRSAMPTATAKRLCPDLVMVRPDHERYAAVSASIMAVLKDVTPLVEAISLDEAFMDVTGVLRLHRRSDHHANGSEPVSPAMVLARQLRRRVWDAERLHCSVGIASSKLVAKLATEEAKPQVIGRFVAAGRGVVEIAPEDERDFVGALPVRALWGVGPKTLDRLAGFGVRYAADLAAMDLEVLRRSFGEKNARHLHEVANAIDDRLVEPDRPTKSISHEETYADDLIDPAAIRSEILHMADRVALRLRRSDLRGRTVSIKARYPDFTTLSRSITLDRFTDAGAVIADAAVELVDAVPIKEGFRLLGVGISGLSHDVVEQLSFDDVLDAESERADRGADEAIDLIHERFGSAAIHRAGILGRGERRVRPNPVSEADFGRKTGDDS